MQIDQLQSIVEHLAAALQGLDQIGADLTGAHVDSALHALKGEARQLQWEHTMQLDFCELDNLIDEVYSRDRVISLSDRSGKGAR